MSENKRNKLISKKKKKCQRLLDTYKNNMVRAIPVRMLYTLIIHLDTSYAFDMACETNIIIA